MPHGGGRGEGLRSNCRFKHFNIIWRLLLVSHPLPPHKWLPSAVRDTFGGTEVEQDTVYLASIPSLYHHPVLLFYIVSKSWMMVKASE